MDSKASAKWTGSFKEGSGEVSTASGALTGASYRYAARFEGAAGLNPEELLGAAHAACFSMAVSAELGRLGITAKSIKTAATVTLSKSDPGFAVTRSHLDVLVEAPGAERAMVEAATEAAKKGCPLSKVLKAEVTMSARYEV
jgi:osmotically inducible protein OsmC